MENERLAKVFDAMAKEFKDDRWRKRSYETAAANIRRHDKIITSGKQAQKEIKGIGKSIGDKIDEILRSGTLQILESRPQEKVEKEEVLKLFEKIYGVGPKTSELWYNKGYRTLEDLKAEYPNFTDAQKVGYYYFDDLNKKIPRSEIDLINDYLKKIWKDKFLITGSYRRKEPISGDIDILVEESNMERLLTPLIKKGFILGNLAIGETKYMGIVSLDKTKYPARRLDIRIVDKEAWPFAVLYFTGDKSFNIELRKRAISLGMSLNEYALTDTEGNKYPAKTEKDIFDLLKTNYLKPEERKRNFKLTFFEEQKGEWLRPTSDLFVYLGEVESQGKIASFDLDDTLITTAKGGFPESADDIILMPKRLAKLKEYLKQGYTIVIFTNQKSKTDPQKIFRYNRISNAIKLLNIPLILFMATGEDEYRKPQIGMWKALQTMIPEIKTAFFVGDAAGRPNDFSDSDLQFAKNIGIDFYTPEQIF